MSEVKYKFSPELEGRDLLARPRPDLGFIFLTSACTGRCAFCTIWKEPVDAHPRFEPGPLCDALVELGTREFNLHGGEAHLSRAFPALIEGCRGRIRVSITTNGAIFHPSHRHHLETGAIRRIFLSVDHHDPALNARSRGYAWLEHNLFATVGGIAKRPDSPELVVNHVLSRLNCATIAPFLRTMRDLGVAAVNLIPIKDAPQLEPSAEERREVARTLAGLIERGEFSDDFFLGGVWKRIDASAKRGCAVPRASFFINAIDGSVYPCDTTMYRAQAQQYVMGNVLEQPFPEIWWGERFETFRGHMYPEAKRPCIASCDPNNFIPGVDCVCGGDPVREARP